MVNANKIAAWIFVKKNKATTEKKEKIKPIAKAVLAEIFPAGIGLNFVRSIFESIIRSCHIFKIADPEAPIAISSKLIPLMKIDFSDGATSIAHNAVNMTKEITPGLIKTYICFNKFTSEGKLKPTLEDSSCSCLCLFKATS